MLGFLGLRDALAAIAGAALMFAVWMGWDAAIDDPTVRREARQEYVRVSELEAAQAREEAARLLLEAEKAKTAQLEQARAAYEAALASARQELAQANIDQQDLEDALDELRRSRPADRAVPTVRELVGDRLRN